MHEMTKQNLESAFAGESQAHMKYGAFSAAAEKEGKPNIARLFKAIAYAEEVHAMNHLKVLGGLGKTVDNLSGAIKGETYEVEEMYPAFLAQAQAQGEKGAEKAEHYALEAEKIHKNMYESARDAALKDQDAKLGSIYICPVCGYTHEGECDDFCPVCGVKKELFKKF
jgi:rubrerythrin